MTSYWRQSVFTCLQRLVYLKMAHSSHMQQLNCCVKKRQTLLHPTCGLQTTQISIVCIMRYGLLCSIVSTTDKSIVWTNWNGGSPMSGACMRSWTVDSSRGYWLTSGEEDFECVCVLKEYTADSLWTDNVDFVHICHFQCDLFDSCIFL